ncbi:hypothetical protein MAP00_003327 [Monascus purpureus]|nr:hypothetical protein MAP00_003327 [Monascus purpureus]
MTAASVLFPARTLLSRSVRPAAPLGIISSTPSLTSKLQLRRPSQLSSATSTLPSRSFSYTSRKMSTSDAVIKAVQERRTIYQLGKNSPVPTRRSRSSSTLPF